MINLNIPFWLMGTIVGVICLCLLGVALSIGYKIRALRSQASEDLQSVSITTAMLNNHFQHNLLAMQVDAVFNSLNALIETERIKLKALVAPSLQHLHDVEPPADDAPTLSDDPQSGMNQLDSRPKIDSARRDLPMEADNIENLSKAEMELAEKMSTFKSDDHRKLEAVA
jgi:hypothetical protein